MSNTPDKDPLKISLCAQQGETSIYIDALILENGDLQLAGQDVGKAPLEIFGDSDYEYWLTIPCEHKDRLLLLLLDQLYHGDTSAVENLRTILKNKSIPHTFENYM
jgi:hypothetical protein